MCMLTTSKKPNTFKFLNVLSNFNLSQHVTEGTHIAGHTIDIVLSTVTMT